MISTRISLRDRREKQPSSVMQLLPAHGIASGGIAVGDRVCVLRSVNGWENGTVLDRATWGTKCIYLVRYDEGDNTWEDLTTSLVVRIDDGAGKLPPGVEDTSDLTWQEIKLRCAITDEPLVDPAYLVGCVHPPQCNFKALMEHISTAPCGNRCPVPGCSIVGKHLERVACRHEGWRAFLKGAPPTQQSVWARGDELAEGTLGT